VLYIANFTDIDDKMIKRANEEGTTISELAARFIAEYQRIAKELNLKPAHINPRATEHIDDMIKMIENIIENGKAYVANGDVYFDVTAFKNYGALSKIPLDELSSGARVEVDEKKRDPRDFVLWKAEKPGEPSWDSPWGKGRPGWHLECSVMGEYYLGIPFDIHGGGQDLIFPHHENEIAQTAAAYGIEKPVKYWLHNGFLTIDSEKMAKSEGNFFTTREVLDNYDNQAVRLFLISGHYRQPLDYNDQALKQASQTMERLRNTLDTIKGRLSILKKIGISKSEADDELSAAIKAVLEGFEREMDDDFNTPGALAEIFNFVKVINTHSQNAGKPAILREASAALTQLLSVLGIDLVREEGITEDKSKTTELIQGAIDILLEVREDARKAKDYSTADKIRDRLANIGIIVSDTKDGPIWKYSSDSEE
jgi:cysteinyl-tRNA synthetase